MSDGDLEAWEQEFQPNYDYGLDQAIIQDIGEFVVQMIGGMDVSETKSISSWASEIQKSGVPDRYIRDIHHWFLVHAGVILADELDADDRKRLRILIQRCTQIAQRRKGGQQK